MRRIYAGMSKEDKITAELGSIYFACSKDARTAVLRTLVECEIASLPIDLNTIVQKLGIKVYPYQANWHQLQAMGLEEAAHRTMGMAFYRGGRPFIMYDSDYSTDRVRFTIAHELGHLILGHLRKSDCLVQAKDIPPTSGPLELAANFFAMNLLAPTCILWGMQVHTPAEIAAVCNIPIQAAQIQAQNTELFSRERNATFTSLENIVYYQFQPFINEWWNHHGEITHGRRKENGERGRLFV